MGKRSRPEADRYLMHYHGTIPWKPSPAILIATARDNLETYRNNLSIRRMRAAAKKDGAPSRAQGVTSPTAFLAKHLSNASTPTEVIRAALADIQAGRKVKAIETQIIYADEFLLHQALSLSERGGRKPVAAPPPKAKGRPAEAPRLF